MRFLRIADIRRLRLLLGFSHFLFFLRDFDRQLLTTLSIKLFVLQHSGWPTTLKLCFLFQFRISYLDQRLWGGIADKSPKVTGGAPLVAACWMPHCCFFGYYLFPAWIALQQPTNTNIDKNRMTSLLFLFVTTTMYKFRNNADSIAVSSGITCFFHQWLHLNSPQIQIQIKWHHQYFLLEPSPIIASGFL